MYFRKLLYFGLKILSYPWAGRAGPGGQGPARSRAAGGTGAAPAPGIGHLPGHRPRLGWDVGLRVGPARRGPLLGRAGLWGAGDQPCRGITGAGDDGPGRLKWVPGLWKSVNNKWLHIWMGLEIGWGSIQEEIREQIPLPVTAKDCLLVYCVTFFPG